MRTPVILGALISTLAGSILLAAPSQGADFGALKNCSDAGDTATVLQVSTTCGEGRATLAALASKGAKAAAASGVNCHWLAGDDKRVICTWDKKRTRGGGSGAALYAEIITSASSSSSKG